MSKYFAPEFESKEIEFTDRNLPFQDFDAISQIIHDNLIDQGIWVDSFSWDINVEYLESEDEDE